LVKLLLGKCKPRVSLATASYAYEHAALARIAAKDCALACQLLLAGIRHDQYFKQGTREEPSFRLYEMLAGVSLRFGQSNRAALSFLFSCPARVQLAPLDAPRPGYRFSSALGFSLPQSVFCLSRDLRHS